MAALLRYTSSLPLRPLGGEGRAFATPFQSDAVPSGTCASEADCIAEGGFGLAGGVRWASASQIIFPQPCLAIHTPGKDHCFSLHMYLKNHL